MSPCFHECLSLVLVERHGREIAPCSQIVCFVPAIFASMPLDDPEPFEVSCRHHETGPTSSCPAERRKVGESHPRLTSVKDAPKEAPNASKDPRRGSAKELLKEAGPIARASTQGTSKESNGTPRESSPRHSKLGTPRESAKGTPRASIKDTPKESTKGSPRESTKGIPKETASLKAAEMKDTEKRCKSPRRSLSQRLPVETLGCKPARVNKKNM